MPTGASARIARRRFRNIARSVLEHRCCGRRIALDWSAYVRIEGLEHAASIGTGPDLVAPHFVGLDVGGVRLSTWSTASTVYSRQKNPVSGRLAATRPRALRSRLSWRGREPTCAASFAP